MFSFKVVVVLWLALVAHARDAPGGGARVVEMEVGGDATLHEIDTAAAAMAKDPVLEQDDPTAVFAKVAIQVHRNGEPQACGTASPSAEAFQQALSEMKITSMDALLNDKYQVETFLTRYFSIQLSAANSCGSTDDDDPLHPGLPGYCDMGPKRTVIQSDYDKLQTTPSTNSLPCRFYTREGMRISSIQQVKDLALAASSSKETATTLPLDLYAVPAGRMFFFGPSYVGEIFELQHVQDSQGRNIVLQTLSLEPRVFDIYHFFSQKESDEIVNKAIGETSATHKFHRSTTGTSGASVFNKRTSENAWDTHGRTALTVKKRCFDLLGIDEYLEPMSDGLQILRYNLTTAYVPHLDYLEDNQGAEPYDFKTEGKGGNRFATILLYFTDLPDGAGGETVFPRAYPPHLSEKDRVPIKQAIKELRESGDADMLKPGSWEEKMAAECRTRLAVKPNATRAVLFYSTFPNGELDPKSFHGGCPVLKGSKLAANLWTWSAIRPEFEGAPQRRGGPLVKSKKSSKTPQQITAVFRNSGKDSRYNNAEVFYDEDGFFGKLGPNDPDVRVNTFATHVWNIKVEGKILKSFVIGADGPDHLEFVV